MLSVLVSFAYMSPQMLTLVRATQGSVRWFLDSGAFTAFYNHQTIDLARYVSFLRENGHLFWQTIALDSIGDAAQTVQNLRSMRASGLNPMPVLTIDMHVDATDEMVAGGATHVCVAGGVTEDIAWYGPRIAAVHARHPDLWLHGLGFTRGTVVTTTRVSSVDSSSWTSGKRWGNLQWFDPTDGGVRHLTWKEIRATRWNDLPLGARKTILGMRLSPQVLASREMTNGGFSLVGSSGVLAFLEYASWLGARGKVMFFAVSNVHDALCVLVGAAVATKSGIAAADWQREVALAENGVHRDTPGIAARAARNARDIWRLP